MLRWLSSILILFFAFESAQANVFIDPEDGYLDASRWLFERQGFIPVPIIITEPAVGVGGGFALVFMDKNKDKPRPGRFSPPTIKGIGAFGTDNQSWGAFGFYVKNWDEDRWRYMGALAYLSLNLSFYGFAGFPGARDFELDYNLKGGAIVQDLRRRIGESNFFGGGRFLYSKLETEFEGTRPAVISNEKIENVNSGLGLMGNYDSRDNTLSPQTGIYSELRYYFFSENFGGDLDYNMGAWDNQGYWRWNEIWGGAFRLYGKWINGDAPFYAKPFIDVRGIAKQRYQGDYAISSELEIRWSPHPRWQYLLFGGGGKAVTDTDRIEDSDTAGTYGVGLRYLMAKAVGFRMGFDIARGPEETVFYIQAGGSWF